MILHITIYRWTKFTMFTKKKRSWNHNLSLHYILNQDRNKQKITQHYTTFSVPCSLKCNKAEWIQCTVWDFTGCDSKLWEKSIFMLGHRWLFQPQMCLQNGEYYDSFWSHVAQGLYKEKKQLWLLLSHGQNTKARYMHTYMCKSKAPTIFQLNFVYFNIYALAHHHVLIPHIHPIFIFLCVSNVGVMVSHFR